MSKKCGKQWTDVWNDKYQCTRNKGHHGDHTNTWLIDYGRQKFWQTKHTFNYDKYCGWHIPGMSHYKCHKNPKHRGYCEFEIPYNKITVQFRLLNR